MGTVPDGEQSSLRMIINLILAGTISYVGYAVITERDRAATLESRLSVLETQNRQISTDVTEIKSDIKELRKHR